MAKLSIINYGINMQLLQQKTLVHPLSGRRMEETPYRRWVDHLSESKAYENLCMLHQDALDLVNKMHGKQISPRAMQCKQPQWAALSRETGYEPVWDVMGALLLLGRSPKGAEAPDWVASLVLSSISGYKNSQAIMRGSMWEADLWVKLAMCFPHSHLIRASLNVDEQTCNYFKSNCKDNRMSFWGLWYIQWQ